MALLAPPLVILTDELVPEVDGLGVALYRLGQPTLPLVEDAPEKAKSTESHDRRKLAIAWVCMFETYFSFLKGKISTTS